MGLTKPRAYQIFDIDYKQSVRVVTISNVTLSGGAPATVDGVNLSLNDRVLVTGQSTGSQNGLYYVTTVGSGSNGTWTRSVDGNETGEIEAGMIIMVTEGTTYADTQWKLTTNDPIVIGSTALTFVQNYSANSISAGTSNVVVNSNANVTISSAGTANVLVVTSTGSNVTGYLTASGNVTGGNVNTGGVVRATGVVSGLELTSTNSSGSEGGQVNLAQPASGSTLAGGITIDAYNNTLRFFEQGGTARGAYIDLTACDASVGTNLLSSGGGGTPGGANTNVQFNDGGTFGGNASFTYDKVLNTVTAGTFAGTLNGTGQNFKVGDDAWIGDINTADTIGLKGQQNAANAYIVFGNSDATGKLGRAGTGPLTYAGAFTATGNIAGGNLSGTSIVGTLTTAAQTNITSVGTLSSLTVTANVAGGNLTTAGQVVATGNITGGNLITAGLVSLASITKTGSNGVGNIGSSTSTFNTIFAKATSAQYADLAEMYVSDADYPPGTVVEFGGEYEITISSSSHSTAVAGIVSTNPSYLMNSTQAGEHVLPIALTGRVPCRVQGPVRKGDVLVAASTPGVAQRIGMNWQPGCVVGKSMEVIEFNEIQTIEVAVGRL